MLERSRIAQASPSSLHWSPAGPDRQFVVRISELERATLDGLKEANFSQTHWNRLLAVYPIISGAGSPTDLPHSDIPPMAGEYRIRGDQVEFRPAFPLSSGIRYRAVFRPEYLPGHSGTYDVVTSEVELPTRAARSTTFVKAVYPSADVLPENLLKFYVHFSASMSRGNIYEHIHVVNESGEEVELPFLEIDEELWDPAMTRLTLFIDPGRIKRGVLPLEEIGPALESGKSYRLVIDRNWRDAAGMPLKSGYRKQFRVGSPDREPPDPAQWKVHRPKSDTRRPLAISFPKPMDHALAQRLIWVTDHSGTRLPGNVRLSEKERRWSFTPAQVWRRGDYKIVVQTTIEDLAGNNIGKPFEVDLVESVQRRITNGTVSLELQIR